MGVYSYIALDGASTPTRGILVADTPRQARDALRARGLTIQRILPQAAAAGRPGRFRKRHRERLVLFVRDLSMLLGSGIPLLDAIDTISQQHHGPFRAGLALLRDDVASGASLAEAMRRQPALFDDLAAAVVEVGEQSGSLDVVLGKLAEFNERSLQFKNRLVTALAYPCFVFIMAVSVAVGLMTFVIPKLLDSISDSGRELPLPTRIVKAASDLLVERWWIFVILLVIAVVAVTAILRSARGRLAWHRLQLRIPLVGSLIRKQAIARISVVMSTLMGSGITFVKALNIARRGTPNLVMRDALERCETAIVGGRDIASALAATGAFPPVVVQVFAVGQQSGRLEEMLEKLAVDYDRQVALASDRLTALLEPALVLMLVGLVALIALATVLPLMEAADVVQ